MLFDYNLSIRGCECNELCLSGSCSSAKHAGVLADTGSLKFDHEGQSLYVRIITSMDGQKSQRSKDVATLSGGEKSFATISLLLSLWEAAGCPIRGLDEFDVFMDPVNRKMATKLVSDLWVFRARRLALTLSFPAHRRSQGFEQHADDSHQSALAQREHRQDGRTRRPCRE
jgi:ABC-type iron transport system FetAB ATPase subunit